MGVDLLWGTLHPVRLLVVGSVPDAYTLTAFRDGLITTLMGLRILFAAYILTAC